jgi:hypothetical protein
MINPEEINAKIAEGLKKKEAKAPPQINEVNTGLAAIKAVLLARKSGLQSELQHVETQLAGIDKMLHESQEPQRVQPKPSPPPPQQYQPEPRQPSPEEWRHHIHPEAYEQQIVPDTEAQITEIRLPPGFDINEGVTGHSTMYVVKKPVRGFPIPGNNHMPQGLRPWDNPNYPG